MESQSPRLPWEVIERVIGFSGDHFITLRNLSLLCRELRPRAFCLMAAGVRLRSRDRNFEFCSFLRAKTHLQPLVRSIVVDPKDLAPIPLLRNLPNLSEIRFTSWKPIYIDQSDYFSQYYQVHQSNITRFQLHQSSLTCFRQFGTNIRTLHLTRLSFDTHLPLVRLLLTFTNLAHLTCTEVKVKKKGNEGHLTLLKHRLSKQLQLKTLAVSDSIVCECHDWSNIGFTACRSILHL